MYRRRLLAAHRNLCSPRPGQYAALPKSNALSSLSSSSRQPRPQKKPQLDPEKPRKSTHTTTRVALSLFNFFLASHLFTTYLFSIKGCEGPSMLPTIAWDGHAVIVSKLHRYGRNVVVGDLVSFHHPIRQGVFGIKRVIGMPGDFVLRDTPRTYGEEKDDVDLKDMAMIQVPEGHCWIAGDNLDASRDSRHFGPLPLALVRGKVVARIWPRPAMYENPLKEVDADAV